MNPYYDPEKFGLTVIGEVEMSSGSYEFDTLVVWRDQTGAYRWAQDTGCSCPVPFDGQGLDTLASGTAHEAAAAIQAALDKRERYYEGQEMYGDAQAVELIDRIMRPTPSAPTRPEDQR